MKLQHTYLLALFVYCQINSAQTATVTGDTLKSAEQPTVATPDQEPLLKIKALPDDSSANTEPAVTSTVSETPSPALEAPIQVSSSPAPDKKSAAAQARNLKTANQLYEKKAYAEAIPYFEKARLSDSSNTLVISRLGDCYRLTSNSTGKLHCYGALIRAGAAEPIHNLYYGQALLEMGEAEKAKEFFDKYDADARGKSLASSFHKMNTYTRNSDAYSVYPSSFNSPQNDLCAVKFHESVVFTSSRRKTAWIRREQGWTDAPYMSLYVAGKDATGADLPPQIFMNDLNSKFHDGPASFTKDFNTVYFTRNNFTKQERAADGSFKLKIMEANLDQNGFSMVKLMPFGNKDFNFAHPSISPDGYTLYFSSDIEGGKGGMDIWVTRRDSSGTWGTPVNLGDKVNTAGSEVFPFIAANGAFYFSSDGHDGMGGLDIYEAKMKGGMPLKIYNMGEPVNSSKDDFGMYLSDDNKTGFISSNRKAGGLDDDIYNLLVLREVKRGKEVKLALKDRDTGDSIPGAKIVINGDTVLANEKGEYLLSAEEGQMYRLDAVHKDFFSGKDSVSAASSDEDSFTREIRLEKDPKLFLRGIVTDAKTGEPLEGATIRLTDLTTNTDADVYTTTTAGDYFKFLFGSRVGDKLAYLVRIDKPGYLQRTMVFTHTIEKPGEVNLNESLNMSLGKVAVGMDLAKMIDIKPIYFDYGKSQIRKDAAAELDKIVQVMNEYPNMVIELGSHTDCRSGAASNLKLSTARAKASVSYIVKKGINASRITGKGYGESKLLNNCACEGKTQSTCPEEEHAKNRRTEFIITKLK